MDFNNTQAIYLQLKDWMCEQLLSGKWEPGGRIPSIRELAVQFEVNPNTMMRAYVGNLAMTLSIISFEHSFLISQDFRQSPSSRLGFDGA